MISLRDASLFSIAAFGLLASLELTSCDDGCRSLHDGTVNANCTPPCDTVDDCESGEVCVEDRSQEQAKICALPCAKSGSSCNCECADGENGYCGDPDSFALTCRGDGALILWQETACGCAHFDDVPGYDACLQSEAEREAGTTGACVPLLEAELFCRYRHIEVTPSNDCSLSEDTCANERQAYLDCQAAQ
jgi:hypothetical protein